MKIVKLFSLLIVLFLFQINLFGQNEIQDTNQFAIKAIRQAVIQYHQQKYVGYKKYMVISMKIMSINITSGEFVLSYFFNDSEYKYLNPTHYVHVNNELILIKVDSLCQADPRRYGITKITEEIKKEALNKSAGSGVAITGRDAPLMIFNYNKNCIKGEFFEGPPWPEKKYWF
ncbi:MAG TPA: hypothetical protein VI413_12865 [Paludibacter sp.]